jgi:hypothetical protein
MLLRLGCSLVGWMVVYAYCLWLATLRVVGCGADSDEFWRLLLGLAPCAVGFALLTGVSGRLTEIQQILRWGFVPLIVLIPLALLPVWSTFAAVNLGGAGICSSEPSGSWQLWWAPLQFVALTLIAVVVFRVWRAAASQS